MCQTPNGNGAPLPEQQDQCEACEQHVGTALDRFRNESSPPSLEPVPRHHAVLSGKQRHQQQVDDHRLRDRRGGTGIDSLWHNEARDKANGIEKSAEKYDVACGSVCQCGEPAWLCREAAGDLADLLDLGHDLLRFAATTRARSISLGGCRKGSGKTLPDA